MYRNIAYLVPGSYVLDREKGTTQTGNFIRRVLLGPDKKVAEPTAPAEDVHAVRVIAPSLYMQPPQDPEFVYLDSGMNELRRESDVDWQSTGQP